MVEAVDLEPLGSDRTIGFEIVRDDAGFDATVVTLGHLIIAGWAGDVSAVDEHVRERAVLGVQPPFSIPVFYRAGIETLTTASRVQVLGGFSSGEVEVVFINDGGEILVAVGSDHTDRQAEAYSIAMSKQMFPKPVSRAVWRYRCAPTL